MFSIRPQWRPQRGRITPKRIGVVVLDPDDRAQVQTLHTNASGGYSIHLTPDLPGNWVIQTVWYGDAKHAKAASRAMRFSVAPIATRISLSCPGKGTVKSKLTVSGTINPAFAGASITVAYSHPSAGGPVDISHRVTTNAGGAFTDSIAPNDAGEWDALGSFAGDLARLGLRSATSRIRSAVIRRLLAAAAMRLVLAVGTGSRFTMLGVLVFAATAANASADTFCVVPATGCDALHTKTTVQQALAAVTSSGVAGVVRLGATTYTEDLTYNAPWPVEIDGAGRSSTTLTDSGGSDTVFVATSPSGGQVTIRHLSVSIPPGTNADGIFLTNGGGGVISDVSVTGTPPSTNATGIVILKGSVSDVTAEVPVDLNDEALSTGPSSGNTVTISDATLNGAIALRAVGTGGGHVIVHRSTMTGVGNGSDNGAGVSAGSTSIAVDDSLILVDGPDSAGLDASTGTSPPGDTPATLRQVTIVCDGSAGQTGILDISGASHNTSVAVSDAIVRGCATTLDREAHGTGSATLSIDYSDYDGSASHIFDSGGTDTIVQGPHSINADPRFAAPGSGDFRLLPTSPALNRDPSGLAAGESPLDLAGLPRIVAGTERDMGAYQHQPPSTPVVHASLATVRVRTPVTFTASATDPDPGDTLSYAWRFDDGATATGATARHAFASGGTHSATVTVTDATGLSARATATVRVTVPAAALTRLRIHPRTFAAARHGPSVSRASTGARVSFRLSRAASVHFTIKRKLSGRRVGGRCVAVSAHNRRQRVARGWFRSAAASASVASRALTTCTSADASAAIGWRRVPMCWWRRHSPGATAVWPRAWRFRSAERSI